MKNSYKILGSVLFLVHHSMVFAQTMGFNYQAIISMPNQIEVPGTNINYLSAKEIALQFTISNSIGAVEYQEEHLVTTSEYGEVNIIIGLLYPDLFAAILWDGTPKNLDVYIDYFDGLSFQHSNTSELLYTPHPFQSINGIGPLENSEKIEAIRLGAGLNQIGNYNANTSANYIYQAISLANADDILDAQIALNAELIESISSSMSDDQQLSLDNHILSLENCFYTYDLSEYLDNTDDQTAIEVPLASPLDVDADGTYEMNVEEVIVDLVVALQSCSDPVACNYQSASIIENNTLCEYANAGENCEGEQINLGMQYQGGYVFSYDSSTNTGLIVSAKDLGLGEAYDWGCYAIQTGANDMSGQVNTNNIIASNCTQIPSAINVCNGHEIDGFYDWYLPSQQELTLLYAQVSLLEAQQGFTAFKDAKYWSSSEQDQDSAHNKHFGNGNDAFSYKSIPCYVRGIRSF